jgi:hypothetical protein
VSVADKLTTIAENQQKVYDSGKQAEYDAFWDTFQWNGTRTNYECAFGGYGWTKDTFKPKYNIVPQGSMYMAFRSNYASCDLVAQLKECGVVMNTAKCTNFQYAFYGSRFSHIGEIDATGITNANVFTSMFAETGSYLHTIDKIKLATTTGAFSGMFSGCANLKNITFEGEINRNGLNFQWSPLTHDSLMSIINALKDYSGDSGTWTITLGATNLAKLTTDELNMINNKGWQYG